MCKLYAAYTYVYAASFYEAGKVLQEIRDKRLYRSTHETMSISKSAKINFAI
ncbi:MAG: hypothetical protein KME64_17490 [Scytonematopsis contorta HA4267-MV1]|jgi:hypothetical protein|nr:hypothetical protein [Scytonematopsis contorta HA4267-MV1]